MVSRVGTRYAIRNADGNGTIAAGAEISLGFQADGVGGELPLNTKCDGVAVAQGRRQAASRGLSHDGAITDR